MAPMRISSVRIKNFRALKDVNITFDTVTTFVGPNGAGKSTVLRALDWFFNGSRAGDLSEADCTFGATAEGIEVQVTFSELTEKDREELGKYAPAGVATFTAWKRWNPNGSESLSANAKGFSDFTAIKVATNATEKKNLYSDLRTAKAELGLPTAGTGPAVDQAIVAWESEHTDELVDIPEILQTNFFGFNSNGKMSGLFDFVLVTGDLRASEEAQDAKTTIIGRILERSVDRSAADEEIAKIVESSRSAQADVYREAFSVQLENIKERLNRVVSTYAPGRTVNVAPGEVELKAPKTTFDVSVLDGLTETPVERQGHGFQRTLLISALQVLAESTAADTEGVICLAIEEPELFQHPTQAYVFSKVLRSLAEDPGKRIQVTYATHSPYFLEARHFDQVRRLTRSADETPVVTVHFATVDEVKTRLDGVLSADTVDRQLDGIVTNQLAVALFAHRAFLVEGTTESAVFYGIGDKSGIGSLEAAGVSIVSVGGKGSIPLAHAILTSLGIPAYTLFDADGGFEARAKANGKAQEKIDSERANHVAANRAALKYFGRAEEDFPTAVVTDNVAIFDDHLEAFLTAEWPEWVTSCDALEAAAGISLRKSQVAYRAAALQAEGTVPLMLTEILAKVKGA